MVNIEELGNSDLERAQGLWDWAQQRMLWCRQQAEEYLKQNPLKRLSKLVYTVANGQGFLPLLMLEQVGVFTMKMNSFFIEAQQRIK